MRLSDLERVNRRTLQAIAAPSGKELAAPAYYGFVEVAIDDCEPFVMFTNNDDFVASRYLIAGANAFEPLSLKVWTRLAREHKGLYLDIGAFTGVYSLAAIAVNPANRVLAFEPTRHVFARLLINIAVNRFDGAIGPVNVALSDRIGTAVLNHYDGVYCLGSGSTLLARGVREFWFSETVQCVPLDCVPSWAGIDQRSTVIKVHDFAVQGLKIDVEGFELAVLAGGREILERCKPFLLVECLSREELEACARFLAPYGYGCVLLDDDAGIVHREMSSYSGSTRNILFGVGDLEWLLQ